MSHPGKGNGGAALPKELDLKGQTQVCYKVPIALKNELSRNLWTLSWVDRMNDRKLKAFWIGWVWKAQMSSYKINKSWKCHWRKNSLLWQWRWIWRWRGCRRNDWYAVWVYRNCTFILSNYYSVLVDLLDQTEISNMLLCLINQHIFYTSFQSLWCI